MAQSSSATGLDEEISRTLAVAILAAQLQLLHLRSEIEKALRNPNQEGQKQDVLQASC